MDRGVWQATVHGVANSLAWQCVLTPIIYTIIHILSFSLTWKFTVFFWFLKENSFMNHLRILWSLSPIPTVHNGSGSAEYDMEKNRIIALFWAKRRRGGLQHKNHVWALLWGLQLSALLTAPECPSFPLELGTRPRTLQEVADDSPGPVCPFSRHSLSNSASVLNLPLVLTWNEGFLCLQAGPSAEPTMWHVRHVHPP